MPNFTDWRQNWTLGVALSLPILDGGRIKANEAIARAGVEEASANLRLARELDALDRASTRSDLTAARAEWEASGSTIQQAQRAYEIAELRFSEGLSTQLELSDARLQLAQSQVTRAEAARNLQVRRIRFALLPALPLAAPPAPAPCRTPPARPRRRRIARKPHQPRLVPPAPPALREDGKSWLGR